MLKIHGDDKAPAKPSGRFKSSVDSCDEWPRDGSLGMLERNALACWGDIISNKQNIAFLFQKVIQRGPTSVLTLNWPKSAIKFQPTWVKSHPGSACHDSQFYLSILSFHHVSHEKHGQYMAVALSTS